MGDFYNGWRRKTGMGVLAVALALMVIWMRSYELHDHVWLLRPSSYHTVYSHQGRLDWYCDRPSTKDFRRLPHTSFSRLTQFAPDRSLLFHQNLWDPLLDYEIDWQWKWSQFNFGAGKEPPPPPEPSIWDTDGSGPHKLRAIFDYRKVWAAPYWSLVLPLTLLSAYLILVQPKKSRLPLGRRDSENQNPPPNTAVV